MRDAGRICMRRRSPSCRRTCWDRLVVVAVLLLAAVIAPSAPMVAVETRPLATDAPRKALAILVGITNYNRLPNLQWCKNDVDLVEKTLIRYCACDQIVVMTSESKEEKFKPTRGNIIAVFDSRLKFADKNGFDRVFIYFAGHGLRDADDKFYFAPQDCAYNSIKETGLSVSSVRDKLDQSCNIGEKILILDTCHAGSTRGGNPTGLSGSEFAGELRDTKRLFTLAGCGSEEESLEWNAKEHGLFTYWLCEGLSGGADRKTTGNEDGRVDTDELTAFVAENVERTSTNLGKPQRPVGVYSEGATRWKADLAFLPPETAEPARPAIVESLIAEADKYRNGGNYAAAIDQVNRALAIDPTYPEPFALRGKVHLERGKSRGETIDPDLAFVDFQAAIDDFDRAIISGQGRTCPEHLASWHSHRCDARYQLGQHEQALADACKVIELQPTSAQAYSNRAKIYRSLGQVEKAAQDDQEAQRRAVQGTPHKATRVTPPSPIRQLERSKVT
jgi:uncharacterized caspase-like protein